MISRKIIAFALLFIIFTFSSCKTLLVEEETENNSPREVSEIPNDGHVRLILNEKSGNFLLYFLSDPQTVSYEPLFNSDEPFASFLSVNVDGNIYRLGNNKKFKTKIDRTNGDPSLVFEAPFVKITQIFTPYKTSGSDTANGIMITIKIQNLSSQRSSIGVRMLLDTSLGEEQKRVPFLTNTQVVSSEVLLEGNSNELFWLSRGSNVSLMGSIVNPVESSGKGPDLVHIANWKRLNDAPWRLNFSKGRSFNNLPNSINDSAVCYFFGPEMIDRDKVMTYTVYLTTEDLAWYNLADLPYQITDPNAAVTNTSATSSSSTGKSSTKTTTATPSASASTATTSATPAVSSTPSISSSSTQSSETVKSAVTPASAYNVELPINILAIENQAQYEAAQKNESADTLTLIKLQEILNLFIEGQIFLKEEDLSEIEKAIERHRIRN